MRASWEPPDARRSGEDRVERNARLGYRLGKEVLAAVENRVILLPRKLAVKRKEPRLQSFPGGDRVLDNIFSQECNFIYLHLSWGWEPGMRWVLVVLAVVGIAASSLALREHYRTDTSPCSINDRWDCGIVNHSPYAMLFGVPVAVLGIAGYLLLGVLAFWKAYRLALVAALGGLGFALYLAHIESAVLGVWCIYCVISLGVISLLTLLILGTVIVSLASRSRKTAWV